MRSGHSAVFFHDKSCTPSVCTPMRAAIRRMAAPTSRWVQPSFEGASFPNFLSSLFPSLTRGVCTDLGLGKSLRYSAR